MLLQTTLLALGSLIALSATFCSLRPIRNADAFRV